MATIGTFEHIGDSEYLGDIFTLTLRAKNVRIVSVSRTNENAPSHRIYIDKMDYVERGVMRSGVAGAEQFSGFLRDGAPHNPEVEEVRRLARGEAARSVNATR